MIYRRRWRSFISPHHLTNCGVFASERTNFFRRVLRCIVIKVGSSVYHRRRTGQAEGATDCHNPIMEARVTDADLRQAALNARKVAEPVGSMHGLWDAIHDAECILRGEKPFLPREACEESLEKYRHA